MISDALKTHIGKANIIAEDLSSTPAGPEHADDAIDTLRDALSAAQRLADYAARCGVDVRDQLDLEFIQIIPLSTKLETDMAHNYGAVRWCVEGQAEALEAEFPGVACPRFAIMRLGAYNLHAQGEIGAELVEQVEWLTHNSGWLFGGFQHGIGTPRATVAVTVKKVTRQGKLFNQPGTAIPDCVTLSEPLRGLDGNEITPYFDSNTKAYEAVREYMRDLHKTANQAWHTNA